jgi:hypothetical protein
VKIQGRYHVNVKANDYKPQGEDQSKSFLIALKRNHPASFWTSSLPNHDKISFCLSYPVYGVTVFVTAALVNECSWARSCLQAGGCWPAWLIVRLQLRCTEDLEPLSNVLGPSRRLAMLIHVEFANF